VHMYTHTRAYINVYAYTYTDICKYIYIHMVVCDYAFHRAKNVHNTVSLRA